MGSKVSGLEKKDQEQGLYYPVIGIVMVGLNSRPLKKLISWEWESEEELAFESFICLISHAIISCLFY